MSTEKSIPGIYIKALFCLLMDVLDLRKWAFGFVEIGMNAIAVYVSTYLFDFLQFNHTDMRVVYDSHEAFSHKIAGRNCVQNEFYYG